MASSLRRPLARDRLRRLHLFLSQYPHPREYVTAECHRPVVLHKGGPDILHDPSKGTGFSMRGRDRLGLRGLRSLGEQEPVISGGGISMKQLMEDDCAKPQPKASEGENAPPQLEASFTAEPASSFEGDTAQELSGDHNIGAPNFKIDGSKLPQIQKGQETKDPKQPFQVIIGDWPQLSQTLASEVESMKTKVDNFKRRFEKHVKPLLASSCLLVPNDLQHPATKFLHKKTFDITKKNASYLSSFDVMCFWEGVPDVKEWQAFLDHMVDRRVYTIEDWESSMSTVQTLMYDYGIKAPKDGSEQDFFRGECDASFSNGVARLSAIIWKGDKIIYAQVYREVKCCSATEAEVLAAFVLVSRASEMKIEKLLVCSDCKPCCKILSGELTIESSHKHRDLYLTLRSKKRLFKKLLVMWKPRELMILADDLTKASDPILGSTIFPAQLLLKWSSHLRGCPLFRIMRTKITQKRVSEFATANIDESYGNSEFDTFFVEVEEDLKLQCLSALRKSLNPRIIKLLVQDVASKPHSFQLELGKFVDEGSAIGSRTGTGLYTGFVDTPVKTLADLVLVVVLDGVIAEKSYHHGDAFHVIFLTPEECMRCTSQKHGRTGCTVLSHNGVSMAELTALFFIYFNGANTKGIEDNGAKDGPKDTGEYSGEVGGEVKGGKALELKMLGNSVEKLGKK